jgi:hypothetical protein
MAVGIDFPKIDRVRVDSGEASGRMKKWITDDGEVARYRK